MNRRALLLSLCAAPFAKPSGRIQEPSISGTRIHGGPISAYRPLFGLVSIDNEIHVRKMGVLLIGQIDPSQNGLWSLQNGKWNRYV